MSLVVCPEPSHCSKDLPACPRNMEMHHRFICYKDLLRYPSIPLTSQSLFHWCSTLCLLRSDFAGTWRYKSVALTFDIVLLFQAWGPVCRDSFPGFPATLLFLSFLGINQALDTRKYSAMSFVVKQTGKYIMSYKWLTQWWSNQSKRWENSPHLGRLRAALGPPWCLA